MVGTSGFKTALTGFAAFFFLAFSATGAMAQDERDSTAAVPPVQIGPRLGVDMNNGNRLFIGADTRLKVGLPVRLNPTLDYHFVEGESFSGVRASGELSIRLLQAGVNALYPLDMEMLSDRARPYIGGGISVTRVSSTISITVGGDRGSDSDSDTQAELNLLGGIELPVGDSRAFLQVELKLGPSVELFGIETRGGDFALLTAGVLF